MMKVTFLKHGGNFMPLLDEKKITDDEFLISQICLKKNYLKAEQLERVLENPYTKKKGLLLALDDSRCLSNEQIQEILELRRHSFICQHCRELNIVQSNDSFVYCNSCGSPTNIEEIMQKEHRQTFPIGRQRQKYGKYRILEEIGKGNMGVVYRAMDDDLEREVAIKVLKTVNNDEETIDILKRFFKREAQSIGHVQHSSIITLYEYGKEAGDIYIAMEYVPGKTLSSFIGKEYPLTDKIKILIQTADALQALKDRNIIHRDIKPDNIMITLQGQVKITDFGLAKNFQDSISQTQVVIGTPLYMSPEQATDRIDKPPLDHRSDLFSYGIVMYELITGKTPFYNPNAKQLMQLIRTAKPRNPREIKPDIPKELEAICLKLLEKQPEKRYQTAQQVVEALQSVLPKKYQYPSPQFQELLQKGKTTRNSIQQQPPPNSLPPPNPSPNDNLLANNNSIPNNNPIPDFPPPPPLISKIEIPLPLPIPDIPSPFPLTTPENFLPLPPSNFTRSSSNLSSPLNSIPQSEGSDFLTEHLTPSPIDHIQNPTPPPLKLYPQPLENLSISKKDENILANTPKGLELPAFPANLPNHILEKTPPYTPKVFTHEEIEISNQNTVDGKTQQPNKPHDEKDLLVKEDIFDEVRTENDYRVPTKQRPSNRRPAVHPIQPIKPKAVDSKIAQEEIIIRPPLRSGSFHKEEKKDSAEISTRTISSIMGKEIKKAPPTNKEEPLILKFLDFALVAGAILVAMYLIYLLV